MSISDFFETCEGKWFPAPPASAESVLELVEHSGLKLPADYLEFLSRSNGGDAFLDVQPCYLRLWKAESVVQDNLDYNMAENIPGFFAFGDAGGEEFFAFETRGSEPWRVVSIPYVPMEAEDARFVAPSFLEMLKHVIPPSK